ncbi:hypothetical protein [Tsukamurella pseudospumae]|uniref:hypothetical protein n=1 Tax=Tsukamurella pseudospumae TaxID=239498 RepID=UPI0012E8EDDA|nr:hypothetical protein [Tsukamurella pseudospumae]
MAITAAGLAASLMLTACTQDGINSSHASGSAGIGAAAETGVPKTFELTPFTGDCASLGGAPNPTYEQLSAVWDRLGALNFQILVVQTNVMPSGVTAAEADYIRNTALQGWQQKLTPEWKAVVDAIPAGGVGRERVVACELGKQASAGGHPELLSAIAKEPYYALATSGYHACVTTKDYPDDWGKRSQKELCPQQ